MWVVGKGVDFVKGQAAVFYKTPQEYSDEAWKKHDYIVQYFKVSRGLYADVREERKKVWDGAGRKWVSRFYTTWKYQQDNTQTSIIHPAPPAEGTVRVKWLKEIKPLEEEYALYADVPLGPNGELDLRVLKRKWGLENCLALDPVRNGVFNGPETETLSGLAVRVLTENQPYLRVIEQPSEATQLMRLRRRELKAAPWHLLRELMLWIKGISRFVWAWLYFVFLFSIVFATWDTTQSKIIRAILLYVFDQDHTMRDIVSGTVGFGTMICEVLPDFTTWEMTGAIGEVGGTLLIGHSSLAF